jgi:polyphosphate kinase 2 (PPK2 family)
MEHKASPVDSDPAHVRTKQSVEQGTPSTLTGKEYAKELRRLQTELARVQEWVKATGQRIVIVFEGRDAAGKGGTIRAITERCSPRVFRIVALTAPSDREKSQLYFQRYLPHFPAAGEVVIFDRSYYNRARVEPVLGFCTEDQHREFLQLCPGFEKIIMNNGIRADQILAGGRRARAGAPLSSPHRRCDAAMEIEPYRP